MNRNESISSAIKRASISTAVSSILSPVSDAPLTGVSIARHFELPVVMEEDEKSEEGSTKKSREISLDDKSQVQDKDEDLVFSTLNEKLYQVKSSPSSEDGDNDHQVMDASTQTSTSKGGGGDEDLVNVVMRDVLYKYIPLPPSTTTTPSVSHSNLENY